MLKRLVFVLALLLVGAGAQAAPIQQGIPSPFSSNFGASPGGGGGNNPNRPPILDFQFTALSSQTATTFTVPGTGQAITFSQTTPTTMFGADGLLTFGPNNQLTNSATLSTETKTVAPNNMILSFYGTGSVTASGVASFTLNGTGAGNQVYHAFTPTAGSLTLTVSGSVTSAVLASVTHETTPRPQDQVITGASAYYGPRFDWGAGYPVLPTSPQFLIEQASANEAPNARDMTKWTQGATVTTAHTATGIDGVANSATLITGGATAATNTVCQPLTITSEAQNYSVYIEPVTVTGAIDIALDGVTYTNIAGSLIAGKFVPFSVEGTLANPSPCVKVVNNNDQIIADANQVEDLAFRTSFIPTGASQVSRAADVATATLPASAALGGTAQTDAMWASLAAAQNGGAGVNTLTIAASSGASANSVQLNTNTSGKLGAIITVSGSAILSATSSVAIIAGASQRLTASWGLSSFAYANGAKIGSAGSAIPSSLSKMWIGQYSSGFQLNGWLSRLTIWAPPLSQAKAQQNSASW